MKTVLFTKEFLSYDMRRWPQFVKDFIENPDVNSIHTDIGSKIAYHRFNTDAYPRMAFLEEKDAEGNIVYVIRKYFDNHVKYTNFRSKNEEAKLRTCEYSKKEKEELATEFATFAKDKPKDPLPEEMRRFEGMRDFSNTATTYVFEMEEWCRHINNKELEDDRKDIFEAVQNIVINKIEGECDEEGWQTINFAGKKEIVFRIHCKGKHTFYYLFDIGTKVDKSKLNGKYENLCDEELLKRARKGFPDWLLYGELDDWKRLEKDDEANLALSDEEVEVLNETKYPYFVNGLAGSGKSTILYYLFAHAYSYKDVNPLDLLFLSYSKKLIDKAKVVVKALLKTNPSYHGFKLTADEAAKLENCFSPFQKFLKDTFVCTEEELNQFEDCKHLDYDYFQKDYKENCKLLETDIYSPAMVWSVIRTFIKGRNYKKPFTIEEYRKLHKGDKTVNLDDFQNIYHIWKNWYKPHYEGKKWDDLDLVSFVLNKLDSGIEYKKYDIIYCDEAQDFTLIENDLILRLSKYTDYDLKGFQNVPIAYAGDPNQTVNPTGFNWKRLKEIVNKTFCDMAGEHIKVMDKTLNNNYRSKRTIVNFANSIQYIRKCFLTDKDENLKPQEQWNPQANPTPGFFFLTTDGEKEDDSQTIKAGFAKTECIITGAEGEYIRKLDKDELTEDSTALNDELLASLDNKTKLYTAISSKGIEFKAVLLYRFADHLPKCFTKILKKEEITNESEKYELAHFFTKLYIAISRAKDVLYIADTQENYDNFWRYFIDNSFVKQLINAKQDSAIWAEKVGGIEIGNRDEYLSRMTENFSPLETARKIYEDAKLCRNAKDMNRAAGYFEEGGDYFMAKECKAYVLLYDYKYKESGEKFLSLGKKEEATKAFWQGCCWEKLVKDSDRAIYQMSAKFMTGSLSLPNYIKNEGIAESFNRLDDTWKKVAINVGKKARDIDSSMVFAVCSFLEKLVERGFVNLKPTIAELYFKNKQYAKAAAQWEELTKQHNDNHYCEHKSYYTAKEETSAYTSEKIFWMHKGGKNDEILKNYSTPRDAEIFMLDERARRIVFSLLLRPQTFMKAFEYPFNSVDKWAMLYKADRIKFIEEYVLADFNQEKFDKWIGDEVRFKDSDLFDKEIPTSTFEKIFSLPLMSQWITFMTLEDSRGYHVTRNQIIYDNISEAICNTLAKKNYKSLASCFLDVVFNNPHYNYAKANKHLDTLLNVFRLNEFSTRDFIAVAKRNVYFDSAGLKGHELDIIKDRLRNFIETKLKKYDSIKVSDYDTITQLCQIYEKAAPQVQDNDGKYVYDVQTVISFYSSLKKCNKLPEKLIRFANIRKTFISMRFKKRVGLATFEDALPENISTRMLIDTFDKEDAIWFFKLVMGKAKVDSKTKDKYGLYIAELVYKFNITISDYDGKEIRTALRENCISFANGAIKDILSFDKIHEYPLKLCAYLYEVFMEEDADKANKYDALSKSSRLSKLHRLVSYLQQRALHFYSYGNENRYKMASIDYGNGLSMSAAREKIRPLIEEKCNEKADASSAETSHAQEKHTECKTESKDSTKRTSSKKASKSLSPLEAAKQAVMEVARNMKKQGLPSAQIHQFVPQLTLEEIEML